MAAAHFTTSRTVLPCTHSSRISRTEYVVMGGAQSSELSGRCAQISTATTESTVVVALTCWAVGRAGRSVVAEAAGRSATWLLVRVHICKWQQAPPIDHSSHAWKRAA